MKPVKDKEVFRQPADSCEPQDDDQVLTVEYDNAGGGYFPRISTERWSMNPEELILIARYLRRLCVRNDLAEKELW